MWVVYVHLTKLLCCGASPQLIHYGSFRLDQVALLGTKVREDAQLVSHCHQGSQQHPLQRKSDLALQKTSSASISMRLWERRVYIHTYMLSFFLPLPLLLLLSTLQHSSWIKSHQAIQLETLYPWYRHRGFAPQRVAFFCGWILWMRRTSIESPFRNLF